MSLWTKASALSFLKHGRWFSQQPEWFQDFMIEHSEISMYAFGERVCRSDHKPLGVYAVLSGQLDIVLQERTGGESIFCSLVEPGAWLGVDSCLQSTPPLTDAVAACDSFLLSLPIEEFHRLNNEHPEAYKIWSQYMAQEYRSAYELYIRAKSYDARQRVVLALVDLFHRVGQASNGPEVILHIRINQSDFASLVGVTRQYVSRFIRDLRVEGVLLWRGEFIAVRNPVRLFELAGLPYPGHKQSA